LLRQTSTENCLDSVKSENVLITEAVRPFITKELVRSVINTPGRVVTPWITGNASTLTDYGRFLPRERVGQVQMPQKFELCLLKEAYRKLDKDDRMFTDDTQLVWAIMGVFPTLISGIEQNIKITTPLDLDISDAIYNSHYKGGD